MDYKREKSGMMNVYGKFILMVFVFFMSLILVYPKSVNAQDDKLPLKR